MILHGRVYLNIGGELLLGSGVHFFVDFHHIGVRLLLLAGLELCSSSLLVTGIHIFLAVVSLQLGFL